MTADVLLYSDDKKVLRVGGAGHMCAHGIAEPSMDPGIMN